MGGNAAAVKVYKADGTLIGFYKANRFKDAGFPFAGTEGSWADMATYVMDLSAYIGEEIYVELHDLGGGAWAHAFFDSVNAYHATAPVAEGSFDLAVAPVSKDEEGKIIPMKMPYKYVIESFCDMLGASKAYNPDNWAPDLLLCYWDQKCKDKRIMHEKSVVLVEELIHKLYDLDEENFWPWFKEHKKSLQNGYE
jgi:hypothetical protein